MKIRKLIEMLAKENWDATVRMNVGLPAHDGDDIKSITSLTTNQKPVVILNSFGVKRER